MTSVRPDKIPLGEMLGAIKRSGYLLEQRIKPVLEHHGYFVETNPAYPDPETGISREYDISAITSVRLSPRRMDFVFPVIICECQNNAQPAVFFEADSPITFMYHEQVKCSGVPVKFWTGREFQRMSEFLNFERFHHYCRGLMATQYCTFSRKNPKAPWIAFHSDAHHQTFNTLINAVEADIGEHYEIWVPPRSREREPVNIQVYYPLLVLQGDLYFCRQSRRGVTLRKVKHLQYRREIWSARRRDTYQIDVIHESFMPAYLRMIEQEMEHIKRRLVRRREVVRKSISRLVGEVRKIKKKESWRGVLEP